MIATKKRLDLDSFIESILNTDNIKKVSSKITDCGFMYDGCIHSVIVSDRFNMSFFKVYDDSDRKLSCSVYFSRNNVEICVGFFDYDLKEISYSTDDILEFDKLVEFVQSKLKKIDRQIEKPVLKNNRHVERNHIYMMKNLRNNYIKIGKSINPVFREKTLQSEEPEIEMIWNHKCSYIYEKKLHNHFKSKNIRGEWYSLTDRDVRYVKSLKWIDDE